MLGLQKYIPRLVVLVLIGVLLAGCEPLDTFGEVLTDLSSSLTNLVDSMVNAIQFPELPSFR
jgi:hypothetical protein